MRFLIEPPGSATFAQMREVAETAHASGLDGVLLTATPSQPAPLVAAAAIAGAIEDILVAVEVPLGDRHPLELAEEAVVVDLASAGRLILVVRPAAGAEDDFEEALTLLVTAFAARPFRFHGRRWQVPANLPENVHNLEHRTRLMPTPRGPRLELWASGVPVEVALRFGLGHLAAASAPAEQLATQWKVADDMPWGVTLPRARRDEWDDPSRLVERLRDGREAFGQDWSAVRAPLSGIREIGSAVRPRVQLDSLPKGLEAHWRGAESDTP